MVESSSSTARPPQPWPRVCVIGAGLGGVAMGVALKRAGIDSFEILEQSAGPGGVWWNNRYPGAAVDTPSHAYSYSFKRFDWTRTHASRDELYAYIESTIDEYGLRTHLRFDTRVIGIEWLDPSRRYAVETTRGVEKFDLVVSCVGTLNVPNVPGWADATTFNRPLVHTAAWDAGLDLSDRTVGVVGTGSTAVQLVTELADLARKVVVFQREPGWISRKGVREYTPAERDRLASPMAYRAERLRAFYRLESARLFKGSLLTENSRADLRARSVGMSFIHAKLAERPDLIAAVTPRHPFVGKRPIRDDHYYETLLRDNVELVPSAVASLEDGIARDATGTAHPIDVLVLATGFKAADYLAQLEVIGSQGRTLRDVWRGEPAAYLGVMVPGFPNFMMIYGPNTNSNLIVFSMERQAEFIVRTIRRMRRRRRRVVRARPAMYRAYNRWLQRKLSKSVWATSNNYFKSASGRVVTQWPYSRVFYAVALRLGGPLGVTTRAGR